MKAAFCTGPGSFEIRDVPAPEPGAGEALIRVKACGICGSDKRTVNKPSEKISGHEVSGVVEQVEAAGEIAVGQEVVVDPMITCGECRYCVVGRTFSCLNRRGAIGYGAGGGFSEYVCAPLHCLHRKPANISFAEAAVAEPLAVAVGASQLRDVRAHDCIVFGAGAIGNLLAQVLKVRGARTVFLADINESHLDVARQLGDFVTINAADESAWEAVGDIHPHLAYDVVGGAPDVTARAMAMLPFTGALVQIGAPAPGALDLSTIEGKRLSVIWTQGVSVTEMREAVRLMESGEVKIAPLITGRFPLVRIEDAFAAAMTGIKVIVEP